MGVGRHGFSSTRPTHTDAALPDFSLKWLGRLAIGVASCGSRLERHARSRAVLASISNAGLTDFWPAWRRCRVEACTSHKLTGGRRRPSDRQNAGPGIRREPGSSTCHPRSARPAQRARVGANACRPHPKGHLTRGGELEATLGATWRSLQPLKGNATRSQFMGSNRNAFAEYARKSLRSLPKYNWRIGPS